MHAPAPRGALASAVLLLLLAAGCGGGTSRDTTDGDSTRADGAAPGADATDTTFQRGSVRAGGDSLFYTACGSEAEAWLDDRTGGELSSAARSLAADGSQAVYVEVMGGPTGAGTIAAIRFLRAAPMGEGGGCNRPAATYLYQALGEEPFWSVYVWEDSLVFTQPEGGTPGPSHVAWPAPAVVPSRDARGVRTWRAEAKGGRPELLLTIEPARCVDGMSGEVMTFRAQATFASRVLEGCARVGTAADEAR